jgi:uncharacterized protein YndB with AHSA1/START domain
MGHEFELRKEIPLDASPEEVWAAIATGPGADSWFMGRSAIEPREGGTASLTVGDNTERSTVTAWEPGQRLVVRVGGEEGGPAMAIEYLIEGRAGSSTVLRLVQSGILGDDWEQEFEAMKTGWDMYLHTLSAYLTHFGGRYASPVTLMRPGAGPREAAWAALTHRLGLDGEVAVGAVVTFTVSGWGDVSGVVDYVDDSGILGIRSDDALYRFLHSGADRGDVLFLSHHLFEPKDQDGAEAAWQAWLDALAIDRAEPADQGG